MKNYFVMNGEKKIDPDLFVQLIDNKVFFSSESLFYANAAATYNTSSQLVMVARCHVTFVSQ